MKRPRILILSLTILISIIFAFGCKKNSGPERTQQLTVAEPTEEELMFQAKQDSFRFVLDSVIFHYENKVETIEHKLFDHGDEMSNELKADYTLLKTDVERYLNHLELAYQDIDNQTETKWEIFILDTRDISYETHLETREVRLGKRENFTVE